MATFIHKARNLRPIAASTQLVPLAWTATRFKHNVLSICA